MSMKLIVLVLIIAALHSYEVRALKCYACVSTKDWSSCNDIKKEQTCLAGINNCLKLEISGKDEGASIGLYYKTCSNECSSANDKCKEAKAQGGGNVKCEVDCCTGDLCNTGSVPMFSAIIMMTCALIGTLSYIL